MALVVESTATNTGASVTSLTITKPAGLVVGDLMVCSLSQFDATADTITTLSGWTLIQNEAFTNGVVNAQYKIATSGDVAASNFTWTFSGNTQYISGSIMRISGFNTLAPVFFSDAGADNTAATGTFATNFTPTVNGNLFVLVYSANDNAGTGTYTSFGVTGSSVTFTELYDSTLDAGTSDPILGAAYGTQTTAANITAFTGTVSVAKDNMAGIIISIEPRVDVTGTNTLVTTTSEAFTQTGTADTVGTNTLATTNSEAFAQSGRGTSPTQWANEAKPSTTWTNESI